jgi:hypothetical protein
LPGLNSIGQPLAGALGMPRRRFVFFDVLGAVLWVGLYVGLGFALHDQLAEAARLAERLGGWALVIAGVALGLYLAIKVIRRQLFPARAAHREDQPRGARGKALHERARPDRRPPSRARAAGPAEDDPRRLRVTPEDLEQGRVTLPRDRGGRPLLLLTERSHERPGGAPPTAARRHANSAARRRVRGVAGARSSGRAAAGAGVGARG